MKKHYHLSTYLLFFFQLQKECRELPDINPIEFYQEAKEVQVERIRHKTILLKKEETRNGANKTNHSPTDK